MITANFFHIKSTNGLFFYGLDYLRENIDLVRVILVRPSLAASVRELLPACRTVACSTSRYVKETVQASWRGDLLFTPTPHPLPGINRQWIVLHDAYPFEMGSRSGLKRNLLRLSLAMSYCRVGYINRSDAQPFVAGLGVSPQRMVFAPNRFPAPANRTARPALASALPVVGLLGTDSPKKNYERLFVAVRRAELQRQLSFRIYGHDTAYLRAVCGAFPDVSVELARSDNESLDAFMSQVEVIASVAEQEGFGRPIASALLAGMPVHLLDRPVFREFFSGGAQFHPDVDALARALPRSTAAEEPPSLYLAPADVIQAYADAVAEMRRLGGSESH
ncbi:glycosyltransferase family protein [Roseateles oligotrophus]|uniref:Uncharacterized protein n=1 Tax=Roseateles oligotrophus TaxID=1769250 RepID=A0ABT2YIJ8_9BURK|nr:hypothetical protein [Roseateles oligotrophus]MCV2369876.1 hypothetical protein [Roseateles oligotrophus]